MRNEGPARAWASRAGPVLSSLTGYQASGHCGRQLDRELAAAQVSFARPPPWPSSKRARPRRRPLPTLRHSASAATRWLAKPRPLLALAMLFKAGVAFTAAGFGIAVAAVF